MNFSTFDNNSTQKQNYKLKYFCQVCNRQCQDKDGFTCHLKSETHKINIEIVSRNPDHYIQFYSKEFEDGFLDVLKRGYNGIFASANKVYMDYISDKNAAHLNATKWTTLTGFIKSLEQRGKIELKVKEKETLIRYLDLSPEEKLKKEKKEKELISEEKRQNKKIEGLMKKANANKEEINKNDEINNQNYKGEDEVNNASSILDLEKMGNFTIEFTNHKDSEVKQISKENLFFNQEKEARNKFLNKKRDRQEVDSKDKKTQNKEEFDLVNDSWLSTGLVVRVKDKNLNNFYNKKGTVKEVEDEFLAKLEIPTGTIIKIDQALLEPVIPQEGGQIKIICGEFKNKTGKLTEIKIKETQGKVSLDITGEEVQINLKHICKFQKSD